MEGEDELKKLLEDAAESGSQSTVNTETAAGTQQAETPTPAANNFDDFWGYGETKAPDVQQNKTAGDLNQPPAPQTEGQQGSSTAAATTANPGQLPVAGVPIAKTVEAPNKVSKQAIAMGAKTVVGAVNLALLTLCRPIMNWRFNKEAQKRFGSEYAKGMELYMDDAQPSDAKEKALKNRIKNFLRERDKKISGIPLSEDEESDLEYALKQYMEVKQTTVSPEFSMYLLTATIMGKRVIDVAVWD